MTETENLHLKKPEAADFYNVEDFNKNADILDEAVTELQRESQSVATKDYVDEGLAKKADSDHTHAAATTAAAGYMSAADKSKLDGIAEGANKYTHPSYTAATGVPTANAAPAFGGTFTVNQVSRDATGHVSAITSRTITIPGTAATASAAGLVSTAAQTFAGNKTFNGQILPAGATAYGTQQARKLASGTAAATTTNCPSGAWYGQHS